ncbi:MAG: MFS transporter [Patescibacteria group bacterium]
MNDLRKKAFQLIILLGLISLLGDIIYESGRSVHGQYLNVLGVNASKVGFIVGLGEFLGYFLRLVSGYFADRTKSYWFFTIFGYGLLFSIPLISLTGTWQIVAFLIILERIGKGIRTPARDTIVSHTAKQVGTGYGFGIAEFIDQIGAILGPIIFAFVFSRLIINGNIKEAYQKGYSFFWLPYILLLFVLFFTYFKFKNSEKFENSFSQKENEDRVSFAKHFWLYLIFVFMTTLGFVNFALVGFHIKKFGLIFDTYIPVLYAIAMTIDALSGLIIGKIYDRMKNKNRQREYNLLLFIPLTAIFIPFFIFSNSLVLILLGVLLLGFGIGIQETIMKAVVADITPIKKRSTAYGLFNFSFGLAFLVGSSMAGHLYDYSISFLIIVLATIEILAVSVFYLMKKLGKQLIYFQ